MVTIQESFLMITNLIDWLLLELVVKEVTMHMCKYWSTEPENIGSVLIFCYS